MSEMTQNELQYVEGGGVMSMVAGGLAFAMIGGFVALPVSAITGDLSYMGKMATFCGGIGIYVGAGCPLP